MRLQNVLEEEVNKYVKSTPNLHVIEKLLGNEGGVLYSVEYNKVKKSLFATSLEKEQLSLKKVFDNICQDSMAGDDSLFRIESMTCKEVMEENQIIGCYVFMLMEQIEPLVQEILEEDSTSWQITDNQKKIKLLSYIIKTCENVEELKRKYPDINIFINNEEICVNQNGEAKILLLDLVKNEIATENQAYEIAIIMNYFSSGLGLESNIQAEVRKLEELKRLYIEEKNQLYILEEKYRKKLNQNLEFAENGDVRAYCNLGYMYEHGMGVDRDFMQAKNWYKKAADRKYAPAYNNLAHMYQKGLGVEKNYDKAREYLIKAAKLNDGMAQCNLGILYQTGKGVKRDLKKARYWYKKAMRNGNAMAKRMYLRIKVERT